jgi:pyruvate formate lyase activating enzyme
MKRLESVEVGTMNTRQTTNDSPTRGNICNDPELRMDSPYVVGTKYWHRLDDGRVQCDLCPRFCKLHDGQRGFCFVRGCLEGQIVLTTYGRSSGYCVDPIEKKPLNHFLPGTPILSFGTAGCNLGCKFCQNWDISKSREYDTLADEASPDVIARAAEQLGCRSVAYTYNDPVIFHEYAIDVAKACRARGIKSVAVTAGEVCAEPRAEFYQYMDAANVDLKAFTERFYKEICTSHLAPVLETLKYLKHETKVWFELTTLLIPGENDSDKELHEMTQWVVEELGSDVPMHFTAFHPDFRMLGKPATPPSTLTRARTIASGNGVRYAYTGNVNDPAGQSTYCHVCDELLIGRTDYDIETWNLTDDSSCPKCGTRCAGVFESQPGDWGSRRLPVRLGDYARTT